MNNKKLEIIIVNYNSSYWLKKALDSYDKAKKEGGSTDASKFYDEIVDNAKRIDRIIGKGICFFYFIQDNNCIHKKTIRC